jgi:hypothetical protein
MEPAFDFCQENCVYPTGLIFAAKICAGQLWSQIVGGPGLKSLHYFGTLHFKQVAAF